jgi:hypothetical protein
MNHLRLSSLFVFTVCALVVVTMALPVYRAYAPAIKAPSARPPMPSRTEPRPGEDECRARLLALAQAVLVYRSQYGHLPWHLQDFPTALRFCPISGLEYPYGPGQVLDPTFLSPESRAKLRDAVDNQVNWNETPIAGCSWHLDMSTIDSFQWNDTIGDWWGIDHNGDAAELGVTLEPSVGYWEIEAFLPYPIEDFYKNGIEIARGARE